jgi:hypothetical protein
MNDDDPFDQYLTPSEIRDLCKQAVEFGYTRGWQRALDEVAKLPLSIEGAWKPDCVYLPNALVYRDGQQWLALSTTASEPHPDNRLWRRVDFPGIKEPEAP